jgi:peptidyl-prolyl cis-trans isomerase D
MIQILRKLMNSKVGAAVALVFLGLIALAFAAGDIANFGTGSQSRDGDRIATVGDETISASQLSQAATTALENLKRQDPRLSMKAFMAQGGLDRVLDQLIDRIALTGFGKAHGIVASDLLIDSEIANIPAFKGPDGKFSDAAFQQLIKQQGINEKQLRESIAQDLIERKLTAPALFAATMPRDLSTRYAALLREKRSGAIGFLPAIAFAPKTAPADSELQAFYTRNRDRFIRPERRVLRYVTFGEEALKAVPAPTDAEVAARYNANKAQYAALETRKVTQLIVPTEAAARAVAAEVASGKKLEAAASAKGLAAASIGASSKQALAEKSSAAVADAVFAAASGSLAAPAKSPLGWHVMRVDGIERRAERSLDAVRGELTAQLVAEKRRNALNDLSAKLEEEFEGGANLGEVSKELGLTITQTGPLTADGRVYLQPNQSAPPVLAKLLQTAFAMEGEGQPQLAEVVPGKTFVIFDVAEITPSAAAPLSEIRSDVLAAYQQERGAAAAKAAADKVLAQTKRGTQLGAAIASLGVPLPPVQGVAMGREQLGAMGQQPPPPLVLMFSMAMGTTKLLPAPNNAGWFVVSLKDIVPGAIAPNDPLIASAQRELGTLAGQEYSQQLARAIRAELGVKREDAAVKALRAQLAGGN